MFVCSLGESATAAQTLVVCVCIFWSKRNEIRFAMTKWMRRNKEKNHGNRFQSKWSHSMAATIYHFDGATPNIPERFDLRFFVHLLTFIYYRVLRIIITATDHLAITVNWIAEKVRIRNFHHAYESNCMTQTPDSHQSDSLISFKRKSHDNSPAPRQSVHWGAHDTHSYTIKFNYWQFTRTIFTDSLSAPTKWDVCLCIWNMLILITFENQQRAETVRTITMYDH